MQERVWKKGNPPKLVRMKTDATTVENSRRFFKKLKIELPYDSSNTTPGHISRKDKNSNSKRYLHPNVHSCNIYNSQDMDATKSPLTDECIKKM